MAFVPRKPLLAQLKKHGFEFDQKLTRALEVSASKPQIESEDSGFPDSYLTLALYRLNTILSRIVELDEKRFNVFHEYKLAPKCEPSKVIPGERLCMVLNEAMKLAEANKTIGVGHYLRAIANISLNYEAESAPGFKNQVLHNTFSIETLMWGLGYNAWTPLSDAPEVRDIFSFIEGHEQTEDISYLMTIENNRIIYRPISTLNPYFIEEKPGFIQPNLALLTHFKEQYGSVTLSELMELEDIINNLKVKESDIQKFFEKHPQFFRQFDYRDIFPHVHLTREDSSTLIPDFILVNPEAQNATIIDLKLPKAKLVCRKNNRDRFSATVMEARAQLLEYQKWFDEKSNRNLIKERLGMEVYKPNLGIVIGSSSEFRDAFDRQKLKSTISDLNIVTYDDIIMNAQKRLMCIKSANR